MVFTGSRRRQAAHVALLCFLACSAPGLGRAEAPQAHYTLYASVNPIAHQVVGSVRIELENRSAPMDTLWLQLYANARRDEHSVFQQGAALPPDRRGEIRLTNLRLNGQSALDSAEPQVLPGDFTQLRVPLPKPLPVGGTLRVEADFETQLPPLTSRTGHHDDFHIVAQWFPKLARRLEDGRWEPHPFDRTAEFRADYATYDLRVAVPPGYTVEASGERRPGGEGFDARFTQSPATDVAFAVCRRCTAQTQERAGTELRVLAADGTEGAVERQLAVIERGLTYLGRALHPFPYSSLVVVVPPRGARADGMEYPGLIVTPPGRSPVASSPLLDGRHVAAHELAHQWFYGLVSSDEVRVPVLDEGLTEWTANDLLRHLYGRGSALSEPLPVDTFELLRMFAAVTEPPPPAAGRPAFSYDRYNYGRAVYARAALALESIRRSHGDARFRRALRRYVSQHAFRHGNLADLRQAFDDAYGEGFFRQTVAPLVLGGARNNVHLTSVSTRRLDHGFRTHVRAHRSGRGALPTWIALFDAQGRELDRVAWPARLRAMDVRAHTLEPVHAVRIDPDGALLLDENRLDHERRLRADTDGSWTGRLFVFVQALWAAWGP